MNPVKQFAWLQEMSSSLRSHRSVRMYESAVKLLGTPFSSDRCSELSRPEVVALNHSLCRESLFSPAQIRDRMVEMDVPGARDIAIAGRGHEGKLDFPRASSVSIFDVFLVAGEMNTPTDDEPGTIASLFAGKT